MLYRSEVPVTCATWDSGMGPIGLPIMSSGQSRRLVAQLVGQQHHHVDGARTAVGLTDDLARIRRFDRVEHVLHFEAGGRQRVRNQLPWRSSAFRSDA